MPGATGSAWAGSVLLHARDARLATLKMSPGRVGVVGPLKCQVKLRLDVSSLFLAFPQARCDGRRGVGHRRARAGGGWLLTDVEAESHLQTQVLLGGEVALQLEARDQLSAGAAREDVVDAGGAGVGGAPAPV